MLKHLCLLVVSSLVYLSKAQSYIYIERTETNVALFDEDVPFGLMNLLKSNSTDLAYYDLGGMSDALLAKIRSRNLDETVLNFVGSDNSVIPLVDQNGEDSIVTLDDGSLAYVYPAPDSVHIDLEEITGILFDFNLKSNKRELHQRIRRIYFTKKYRGEERAEIVCSLSGEALLKFDAFKVLTKLKTEEASTLISTHDKSNLWNYLRARSIAEMEGRKSGSYVTEFELSNSGRLEFLPGEYWPCSSWNKLNLRHSNTMYQLLNDGVGLKYLENYDCEKDLPFHSFYDNLEGTTYDVYEKIVAHFDSSFTLWYESDIPHSDEFGDPIVEMTESGGLVFLYDQPEVEYYWIDAQDIEVFKIEDFVYDSIAQQTKNQIERLIFAQRVESDERSKVLFHLDLDKNLDVLAFLPKFETITIQGQEWWQELHFSLNNRKLRYRGSKKKNMMKLNELINFN